MPRIFKEALERDRQVLEYMRNHPDQHIPSLELQRTLHETSANISSSIQRLAAKHPPLTRTGLGTYKWNTPRKQTTTTVTGREENDTDRIVSALRDVEAAVRDLAAVWK